MRALLLLAVLVLFSGCQRTSEQDALLAALPAEIKLPTCVTMRVREEGHYKRSSPKRGLYEEIVVISTSPGCIDRWAKSLEGTDECEFDVHGCPMYARISEGETVFVVQSRVLPSTVTVAWGHAAPLPGIKYEAGQEGGAS